MSSGVPSGIFQFYMAIDNMECRAFFFQPQDTGEAQNCNQPMKLSSIYPAHTRCLLKGQWDFYLFIHGCDSIFCLHTWTRDYRDCPLGVEDHRTEDNPDYSGIVHCG